MNLPNIAYLRWFRELDRTFRYDLTLSGMPEIPLAELGVAPGDHLPHDNLMWGSSTLQALLARTYGLSGENVLPVNGTTFGVFLACAAVIEPGDTVLVEEPAYEPLFGIPRFLGARVTRFQRPLAGDFALDHDALAAACGPGVKLVVLSDPHNPSGIRLSMQDRDKLGAFAEARGIHMLIDEVYMDFVPSDPPIHALRHGERLISVASLTKVHGFPRLRAGWMLASKEIIARAAPLYDYTIGNLSGPAVRFTAAAIERRSQWQARAIERSTSNRAVVKEWVNATAGFAWTEPDAGITAFVRLADAGGNADAFLEYARVEHSVCVVPGRFFQMPGGFRVGYGCDEETLRGGLAALTNALTAWRARGQG